MAFNALIHKHRYVRVNVLMDFESLDCCSVHLGCAVTLQLDFKICGEEEVEESLRVLQQLASL